MTFRRRLYLTLTPDEKGGFIENIFESILVLTILLNILIIILESVPSINTEYITWFKEFEIFSLIFFTIEYSARFPHSDQRFRFFSVGIKEAGRHFVCITFFQ